MTKSDRVLLFVGCLAMMSATSAQATADGPDYFQVTSVTSNSTLNMRSGPSLENGVVGQIPSNANGVANFGCIGGLSYADWQNATEDERDAALKTRWCLVGYERVIGWSAGWYLTEGSEPDALRAGDRLSDLSGSEWQLRDISGAPVTVEAWVKFAPDGSAIGDSGCNQFNGVYKIKSGETLMGPLAITQRACVGDEAETETVFMSVLGTANRVVATHLLLALFEDDTLLATLTRRDGD